MTLSVPNRLGPYEILSLIGSGGMGEVYRARDPRLERDVAVKILPERFAADSDLQLRFEREAKAAAAVGHPHICQIFDVGHDAGLAFIVMEYLEGESLASRLARARLPLQTAVQFAAEIAEALAAAHHKHIVHRDLKPANVMIVPFGVKLVDFGVAKFRTASVTDGTTVSAAAHDTARGMLLGTLQYMAPEQLDGAEVGVSADLFGLGALLYEMVTGVTPFAAHSQSAIIGAILTRDPPPVRTLNSDVPGDLERLISDCLAKDQALRPTADAAAQRLRALARVSGTRAAPRAVRMRAVRSVAVIPFAASLMTEDEDAFVDGTAEELIQSLGTFRSLRVISRESARRYRGSDKHASQIAVELGVDAIVRGRVVEHTLGQLAVFVELVAADDAILWSSQYECERSDVLNVQDQIAQTVAATTRSSSAAKKRPPRKPRLNPRGHELYLKARFTFDNRLGNWLDASFDALTQSIEIDPAFAPARAALSRWYLIAGLRPASPETAGRHPIRWADGCREAEREAQQALKLDANLPEAQAAMARVFYMQWQLPRAEEAYRKSLALGGGVYTHASFSEFLSVTNRPDEAIRQACIARDLDPLATMAYERLAGAFYAARRFDECLDACKLGLELSPSAGLFYYFLGQAQEQSGSDDGVKSLTIACARMSNNPSARAALAASLLRKGSGDFASKLVSELIQNGGDSVNLAEVYAAAGQHADALDQLELAFEAGSPYLLSIGVDPKFDPLRSHLRFKRLLNGIGLSSYLDGTANGT